ncbi:uncharacterized protein LOC121080427, partial [Falco naumanni]|uniref:uncharacterized protein LOC121080427 n=1 Tax=Falco naumanni TaxID=148594 RepID=UPI001ADEB288
TTKEVPYSATELAKLKKDFGRTPKESETEYVWRVSLSGGDQILLSEKEAKGYWGPGVFLTTGNQNAPWSLTQRTAYWAGGLNLLERGDPLAIVGTVDQLVKSVQMMYDLELKPRHESPMMMPVDPEQMTPLIRGLLDSLKPIGIQLQGKIQAMSQGDRAVAALEGIVNPNCRPQEKKVWTWGEVTQELINYGRKYGPVVTSVSKPESKVLRRTEMKAPPNKSKETFPVTASGDKDVGSRQKSFWSMGWRKGIPRELMDGLPTEKLGNLVLGWPENPQIKVENPVPSAPLLDLTTSHKPLEN